MENKTFKLTQTAIFAALCFIAFRYFQIKIPIPGGSDFTSFHFGNVFLVLSSLLLGGLYGGLAGAIGMTIGDLLDPYYILIAPKTFLLKLCIGLIVGFISHNLKQINKSNDKKYILKWSIISSIFGMGFNVIFDPIAGYLYNLYLLGQPQNIAATLAKISAGVTLLNAVLAVVFANIFYIAIRPALFKNNLIVKK